MKPHRPFLELAAMAIDYPLTTPERRDLDEHLATCQACVRSAAALRADAAAVGSLPPITLSERRGDLILAAALHPVTPGRPLRLVAIAALLGLLIIGSIAVGAQLLDRMADDLAVVIPVPSLTASPDASPTANPTASATATSPTGTLVVTREDLQRSWVELVTPVGTVTRLAEGTSAAWLGADKIVYECPMASPDFVGICEVDPTSPGPVQTIMASANQPAPAPDGVRLRSSQRDRRRRDVDRERRRFRQAAATPGRFLEWSPDGAWLAGQPDSASAEIAIVGADGTGLRVLAPGFAPAWSPSGDRLVHVFNDATGAASLQTVDVATGEVTILYAPSGVELSGPAWFGDRGWVFVQDGNVWRLDVGGAIPCS